MITPAFSMTNAKAIIHAVGSFYNPWAQGLNTLIGSAHIEEDFEKIVMKYPETLQCVPLLLAVRGYEIYAQDDDGAFLYNFKEMNYSMEQYIVFMRKTGLFDMIANHLVNNLVDYALGIETGLDFDRFGNLA